MKRSFWLGALLLLAIFAASPGVLIKILFFSNEIYLGVTKAFLGAPKAAVSETEEIRFTGDIMLARHVETLLKKEGSEYPYQFLTPEDNVVWVGNFEATVPNAHTQTKDFTFAFSVDRDYVPALHDFGFTHLSLANNHSYDFGKVVFTETVNNLADFTAFGHPSTIEETSVTYVPLKDKVIGILALNTVGQHLDKATLSSTLQTMETESDFQIAYIHWGDEYKLTHNQSQETLAETLIDSGADAVIGHHPHVVQDIALYKNKPIFYSLGNFIFDQYFDEAVQKGLVVKLSLNDEELHYDLMPVTSVGSVAAPREMVGEEKSIFLSELAARSDGTFAAALQTGHITMSSDDLSLGY